MVRLFAVLLAGLAMTTLPESGTAAWKPQKVVGPGHQVGQLTAAVSEGREVLGWVEDADNLVLFGSSAQKASARRGAYVAVRRDGDSRFGRPHRLTRASVSGLQLAAAADGTTLAAWVTDQRKVQIAWWLPASRWTQPATVASRAAVVSSPSRVSLALAPEGQGLIAWLSGSPANRAVEMAPVLGPGQVGPTQRIAQGPEVTPVFAPAVDAANQGVGVVAWAGRCPTDSTPASPAVAAVTRDGVVLGTPEAIPASECPTAGLDAEIDDQGNALVLLNGKAFDLSQIRTAFMSQSSGAFTPASKISGNASSNFGELAGTPAGSALAVWSASNGGHKQSAVGAWSAGGGIFDPPQVLGRLRSFPRLAASTSGDVVAVWQTPSLRIALRSLCADGAIGVPVTVSEKLFDQTLALPEVAVAGSRALVTWAIPAVRGRYRGIEASTGPIACGAN